MFLTCSGETETVSPRHVQVGKDQVELVSCLMRAVESGEGRLRTFNSLRTDTPLSKHFDQNYPVSLIVVDDKHGAALQDFRIPGFQLVRLLVV